MDRHRHLEDLAIVVTGAGRGIGRAVAVDLAARGASVVVNDVDADAAGAVTTEIARAGGRASAHAADISSAPAASGLVAHCLDQFGRLDGLVNNAALMSNGTIEEYDAAEFQRLLSVNVVGLANCGVAALRHMLDQGQGSVVNVTSGAHLGMEHMGLYGATKGAVASLTYTWALETRGRGVTVNAVSPWAKSQMAAQTDSYRADRGLPGSSSHFPDPKANAPAIAHLLSPAAAHISGQIVRIQGTQLSLMCHPAVMRPVLERDHWDVADVERAFEDHLSDRLAPIGIAFGDPATDESPTAVRVDAQG